jgi:hypothetical protein
MFTALSAMAWYYTRRCRALFYGQALTGNASPIAPHAAQKCSAAREHADVDVHNFPAAADSAAGELLPADAIGEEAAAERHELLPRPFLRGMFPTWRDYEHVHVSALRVTVPPLAGWGKCGGRFPVGFTAAANLMSAFSLLQVFLWLGKDAAWNVLSPAMCDCCCTSEIQLFFTFIYPPFGAGGCHFQ